MAERPVEQMSREELAAEVIRLREANTLLHRIADKAYAVEQDAMPLEEAFDPYSYAVGEEEIEALRNEYQVCGDRLRELAVVLSDEAHDLLGDYRKYGAQLEEDNARLKAIVLSLAARVAAQSELLSRRAERTA